MSERAPQESSRVTKFLQKESKERDPRVTERAELLSRAVGESTPTFLHRFRLGWRAQEAATIGGLSIKVGYREPWLNSEKLGLLGLRDDPNPRYGIRFGESDKTYRKAKHIEEKLGEHTVQATGAILYELARQQSRLSARTISEADRLGIYTVQGGEQNQPWNVTFPDVETGKMVKFVSSQTFASGEDPAEALLTEARETLANNRHKLERIPAQAVILQQAEGGRLDITWYKNRLASKTQVHTEIVDDLGIRLNYQYLSPTEQSKEKRDALAAYRETIGKPLSEKDKPGEDEAVIFLPGWSMGGDTKSAETAAQAFADKKQAQTLIIDSRPDKVIKGDSLYTEAQAIAALIQRHGWKNITLVGHSEGAIRAENVAYLLQEMAKQEQPGNTPKVDGLILIDSVGHYKLTTLGLGVKFVGDMLATAGVALKEKRKYTREQKAALQEPQEGQSVRRVGHGHGAEQYAKQRATQAGLDIGIRGMLGEMWRSKLGYPRRFWNQVSNMASYSDDYKARKAALEMPIILVQGEQDPISNPEKIVPGYKTDKSGLIVDSETGDSFDPRERYLQKTLYNHSSYVRMVTARHMGRHGLPLFRPEAVANASLGLLDRARRIQHPSQTNNSQADYELVS